MEGFMSDIPEELINKLRKLMHQYGLDSIEGAWEMIKRGEEPWPETHEPPPNQTNGPNGGEGPSHLDPELPSEEEV
jgi:hypothetical protein